MQYAADACPADSIYGSATAETPLLDEPLRGPVYLRSSSGDLPDLVVALKGQFDIDLVGQIDSTKEGGCARPSHRFPMRRYPASRSICWVAEGAAHQQQEPLQGGAESVGPDDRPEQRPDLTQGHSEGRLRLQAEGQTTAAARRRQGGALGDEGHYEQDTDDDPDVHQGGT